MAALMGFLQKLAMLGVDLWMALRPRPVPDKAILERCKIISHRGEHDNRKVRENTLPAYRIASAAGVWGIEADIRWTRDLVPVIIHDPDGQRVFGNPVTVANLTAAGLRQALPLVPTLAELVAEFGGKTHLMLEIKDETFPDLQQQRQILARHLAGLVPRRDYHLLALDPALFERFDVQPRSCCLPVSETNSRALSEACLKADYGGFTGHYLLLNEKLRRRHAAVGQPLGTGFVSSRNCLLRELNRGVEWIFSNHALRLQAVRDAMLDRLQ